MPRGRLIFPFAAELALLDTVQMAADPDGPGGYTSGYDDTFREPVKITPSVGSRPGKLLRRERRITLMAQVEDDLGDVMEMLASGNSPQNSLGLVFHFTELEQKGCVEALSGKATIKAPGARLISLGDPRNGRLIERYDNEPGYWATMSKSMGYGLGPHRNLLLVVFQERDTSVPAQSS